MSDMGWSSYAKAEEEASYSACFESAIKNGYTEQEAEDCDDGDKNCKNCPFKQK